MENKIKLELKKKNNATVKIGEQTIKVKTWLNVSEVAFIVDEVLKYFKQLIMDNNGDAIALVSAFAHMDMLIVALATNIDVEDLDADQIGSTGLFVVMQEKVLNYDMIKRSIIGGMSMVGDGMIVNQLGNIASIDDLENGMNKISEYMEGDNSEHVQKLVEVMLANNPRLAEELNKTLEDEK